MLKALWIKALWIKALRGAAAAAVITGSLPAQAEQTDAQTACIEVSVNGQQAPSFSCLTQKLQPSLQRKTPDDVPDGLASEGITQRPSNQLGLFNRAATAHRMGNTFGHSAYPQPHPGAGATPR